MTDIKRSRGDTKPEGWTVKSRQNNGAVQDLTGWSGLLTVDTREFPDDNSTQQFQISGTVVDAAAGKIEFPLSAGNAAYTGATYGTDGIATWYFDVQLTDPSGYLWTYDKGQWIIEQDITK